MHPIQRIRLLPRTTALCHAPHTVIKPIVGHEQCTVGPVHSHGQTWSNKHPERFFRRQTSLMTPRRTATGPILTGFCAHSCPKWIVFSFHPMPPLAGPTLLLLRALVRVSRRTSGHAVRRAVWCSLFLFFKSEFNPLALMCQHQSVPPRSDRPPPTRSGPPLPFPSVCCRPLLEPRRGKPTSWGSTRLRTWKRTMAVQRCAMVATAGAVGRKKCAACRTSLPRCWSSRSRRRLRWGRRLRARLPVLPPPALHVPLHGHRHLRPGRARHHRPQGRRSRLWWCGHYPQWHESVEGGGTGLAASVEAMAGSFSLPLCALIWGVLVFVH
jgi:hypothetical protein